MTPTRADTLAESSFPIEAAMRDPLSILLLGTDILRQYGERLDIQSLREQRDHMHQAAKELVAVLSTQSTSPRP